MLREELFFIDSPNPQLVENIYNSGIITYDETAKAWTFETTADSSDAYYYFDLGKFNIGDKVIVECEIEHISGESAYIGLHSYDTGGTKSFYKGTRVTGTERGKKKKVVFEIVDEKSLMLLFGETAKIGKSVIKNVQIKKITDTTNIKSEIKELVASVRKNNTTGVWELIPNRNNSACTITTANANDLQITFTDSLSKTGIAFVSQDFGGVSSNYIVRCGYPTVNGIMIRFVSPVDGAVIPLASVANNTYFNVRMV